MASRILIVDDNPWVRRMVGTMLQRGGHTVDTAGSGEEGLEKATSFAPELIMTDVLMTGMGRLGHSCAPFAVTPKQV
jgi:CheY-like chemotaxis protein